MARLFDDAQNEYLTHAAGVIPDDPPFSMGCWFRSDDITNNQTLLTLSESAIYRYYLFADGSLGGDPVRLAVDGQGGIDENTVSTSGYSVNTWHHALAVVAATNQRAVYLDGGSKGLGDGDTLVSIDPEVTIIGATGVPDTFMSGRIAEAAIWNAALTDAEADILAKGYSPLFVRPQNLVAYWPLIRDEDQDRLGSYDMTAVNTPSIAPHPPIIYPAPLHLPYFTAAAPPAGQPIHLRALNIPHMRQWQPRVAS